MRARRVMLWIAPVIGIVLISWMANRPTNLNKERGMKSETSSSVVPSEPSDENDPGLLPIAGDDAEWQKRLTPEQFKVTRRKGTERAFTGELWDNHEPGIYRCVCCGQKLFDADAKFESGTGWPSFFQPLAPRYVGEISDRSWFMVRTEVVCSRCDAHLGHVFDDGPKPTGLRYCMNSAAMTFEKRDATDSAKEKSGPDSR